MMTIIGYKGNEYSRRQDWLSMLESKKSYNLFKDTEEQEVADLDKRMFDYFLGNYVNVA